MFKPNRYVVAGFALYLVACTPANAQDEQTLARAAKNPFADLINLQFLYDASPGMGSGNQTRHTLTLQPVIPFSVNADWSLITRTIMPLTSQPGASPGQGWTNGPGDTQLSMFLSPARGNKLVWGVGPVFQIPSASNDALGQGKWGIGPTAGVLWFGEQWSFGGLTNNIWSVAGDHSRPPAPAGRWSCRCNFYFRNDSAAVMTSARRSAILRYTGRIKQ